MTRAESRPHLPTPARAVLDPSALGALSPHLPLIPEAARRRRHVFIPADHRFKAAARFLQALWREDRDLPIGNRSRSRQTAPGPPPRLAHLDRRRPHGANFMTPAIAAVATRALAYREPGAAYDISRLRTNLLSSQPLVFNLFGPLTADPALATRFMAELFPGALANVTDILFEHSPGRGDPRFTADRTAFDVVIRGTARPAPAPSLHRDESTVKRPRPRAAASSAAPRNRNARRPAYSSPPRIPC